MKLEKENMKLQKKIEAMEIEIKHSWRIGQPITKMVEKQEKLKQKLNTMERVDSHGNK